MGDIEDWKMKMNYKVTGLDYISLFLLLSALILLFLGCAGVFD